MKIENNWKINFCIPEKITPKFAITRAAQMLQKISSLTVPVNLWITNKKVK